MNNDFTETQLRFLRLVYKRPITTRSEMWTAMYERLNSSVNTRDELFQLHVEEHGFR